MPPTLPEQIDQYRIIDELGHGGFGIVYLGYDPLMDKKLAIKTLREDATAEIKRSFWEEAKKGRLEHDNIVILHRISSENAETPFIAMEYIDGDTLDRLIKSRAPLSLAEKLDIIRQVCLGLYFAHSNGVVHRDIKPENAIRRSSDGRVKILDFGIAKVKRLSATADLSKTTVLKGTLGYIAPERWSPRPEDHRVDIFSTGVMLYYLVTGREPFLNGQDDDPAVVMGRIISDPYPPLGLYLTEFPPELTSVLDRALAKDPANRYYSALDFADDLASLIEELDRARVPTLLRDAQSFFDREDWEKVLALCQQINNIDRGNHEAKALKSRAQQKRDEQTTEETVNALSAAAEEALSGKRYDEAIRNLQALDSLRPGNPEIQQRLLYAIDRRNVQYQVDELVRQVAMHDHQGDPTGALQRAEQAGRLDPENLSVQLEIERLNRKIAEEEGRKRNDRHIFNAEQKIAVGQFTGALEILDGVRRSGFGHEKLDALYDRALQGQKAKEVGRLKEQIVTQAAKYRYAQQYEPALAEVERGLEVLKGDTALLGLRQDIQSEFNQYQQNKSIAEAVKAVQDQSITSIDGALVMLREAMRTMPGVKAFVTLEGTLLKRKDEERNQSARAECLRKATEEFSAGRPDRTIQTIESYLLKSASDTDIDAILQKARQALEQQRHRDRISQCATTARLLLDEGRFDEAVGILQPVYDETQDGELGALLERALKGKTAADAEVAQLARHIKELRRENRLAEAIVLIERQDARILQNPALREILEALKKGLARDEALAEAVSRSTQAVEASEWKNAREPLNDIRRVFGDFDALARALAGFEAFRTREADRLTGQSVAAANAAVLAGDKRAAVKALEAAKDAIPFVTALVAQDWRKRADEFDVSEEEVPPPPPQKLPVWIKGGAVALAVIAVAILLWNVLRVKNATVEVTVYQGDTVALPDADVQVDRVLQKRTDQSGKATLEVKPGEHIFTVSKDHYGNSSYTFKPVGGSYNSFTRTLTDNRTAGYLVVDSGNLHDFEVFVGSSSLGIKHKGEKIEIAPGSPKIHYQAEGYEPSKETPINIVKGQSANDSWTPVRLSTAPKVDTFRVTPSSVEPGSQVTIQWSTTNAQKVTLEQIENGRSKTIGDDLGPNSKMPFTVTSDTAFRLIAKGSDGTSSPSLEKPVTIIRPGFPTVLTFAPAKDTVNAGETIVLSWTTNKDATGVSIDHGVGNSLVSNGSTQVTVPLNTPEQITYSITPIGKTGAKGATVNAVLKVIAKAVPLPTILSFRPDKLSVKQGESVLLQWETKDARVVSISPLGTVDFSGTKSVPLQSDTTFVLTARNADGKEVTQPVAVKVTSSPPPPPPHREPDRAALDGALNNFESVFKSASGGDKKACTRAFSTLAALTSKGIVDEFSGFCGDVATFKSTHDCSSVPSVAADDDTKATWSCKETVSFVLKDGGSKPTTFSVIFGLAKNSGDGTWRVVKWDPRM